MRCTFPLLLACTATAQLVYLPNGVKYRHPHQPEQLPIMPVVPDPNSEAPQPGSSSGYVITDALNRDRNIQLFAGFTRDVESIGERLDDSSKNATVLAPENSAIQGLPRKPWEDPKDYEMLGANAYGGKDGEDRAHRNLRRFVESHIIPQSPWKENEKVKTIGGNTVWFEQKDGKKVIQPGNIQVMGTADKVDNGEVWVLKGAVNYA